MTRGRIPGQGKWAGGRTPGSPNKKGRMEEEIIFRCDDELWEALNQAAVAAIYDSVHVYCRDFLRKHHVQKEEKS